MKHGSLFSGIGGFDLAAEWMGWDNVFHCEINPFCQKVLKHHFPKSISYDDIKKTDFTIHRGTIDVLTGGFPCQPYSQAGKRLGKEDERHLWPEMLRAIREIQPGYVVGENVRGLTNWNGGVVFDEVQADLEAEGYTVLPFLLPACAVNAPHRRDRIWFIAYTGLQRQERTEQQTTGIEQYGKGISTNTESGGAGRIRNESETSGPRKGNVLYGGEHRIPDKKQNASNSNSDKRCEGRMYEETGIKAKRYVGSCSTWENGGNWENFPTESPICGGDDGLPTKLDGITFPKWRNESIKGYGNAIVPQVVFQIFKAIETL